MINDSEIRVGSGLSRRRLLAATACVASTAFSVDASARVAPSRPRILKYGDHEPLGGMRTRFLKDVFFPAIERESNGRLKIEDHWDGQVAAAYDALGAVSNPGVADMATVVPEYTADELPLHQLFKSYPVGPSGSRQVEFFRRAYSEIPAFPAELERNNIVPVFFGTGYPVAFFSTAPMADLNQLEGGRWRTASFWHRDFLSNTGATPVTMHWGPEVAEALRARTMDGLMVNVDSGYMLKVHEAAPNVLVSKALWLGHLYLVAVNSDVWNGLAQEDKDAVTRAAEVSYQALGSVMDGNFDAQLEDLRSAGANVRVLGRDEVDRWATVIKYREVQSAWAQDQQSKGVEGVVATLADLTTIMGEFIGSTG